MDVKVEEKPDLKPLPQRNGPKGPNKNENGGPDVKPQFQNQQNRGGFQNKGGNRGRGGFGGGGRQNEARGPNNRNQGGGAGERGNAGGRNNEVC